MRRPGEVLSLQDVTNAARAALNVKRATSGRHLLGRIVKNAELAANVRNIAAAPARFVFKSVRGCTPMQQCVVQSGFGLKGGHQPFQLSRGLTQTGGGDLFRRNQRAVA